MGKKDKPTKKSKKEEEPEEEPEDDESEEVSPPCACRLCHGPPAPFHPLHYPPARADQGPWISELGDPGGSGIVHAICALRRVSGWIHDPGGRIGTVDRGPGSVARVCSGSARAGGSRNVDRRSWTGVQCESFHWFKVPCALWCSR